MKLTDEGRVLFERCAGPVTANSISAARRIAVQGVGICYLPPMAVTEDLASGRLEALLAEWSPRRRELYAVYPTSRHMAPRVRAFLEHVRNELQQRVPRDS